MLKFTCKVYRKITAILAAVFIFACLNTGIVNAEELTEQDSSDSASKNTVTLDVSGLNNISRSVWVDGKEYSGESVNVSGSNYSVILSDASAKTAIVYSYNSITESDRHKVYPTNMHVWMLGHDGNGYTATRAPEFDGIMQYAGSSIRVTGKKGIRMITSVSAANKEKLISANGINGYTLEEYGTVIAWDSDLSAEKPLIVGADYAKFNHAYKKGVADPVFSNKNGVVQYTNVLVGFTDAQCVPDLAMRPYMKLNNPNGESIALYGAPVYRSIGYIAKQNSGAFKKGTDAYNYVWGIINYVNDIAAKNDEYSKFPIAENNKIDGKVIILDPGHGTGAGGAYKDYVENVYNLIHANYIKQALESCGATVIMTRESAADVNNYARVSMANKYALEVLRGYYAEGTDEEKAQIPEIDRLIGVMQSVIDDPKLANTYYLAPYDEVNGRPAHADLEKIFEYEKDPRLSNIIYISIHSNATGNIDTTVNGTVTYYMDNLMNSEYYTGYQEINNRKLATYLFDRVTASGGYARRGVSVNDFFMVREVNIPSALIEIGFHTNTEDRKKLTDENVQKRVANGVAYAVIDYFEGK